MERTTCILTAIDSTQTLRHLIVDGIFWSNVSKGLSRGSAIWRQLDDTIAQKFHSLEVALYEHTALTITHSILYHGVRPGGEIQIAIKK
jgi:hypothetical protein